MSGNSDQAYEEFAEEARKLYKQKQKELEWVKERREQYYKRQESSARHPPDEDEWNK